MRTLLFFCCTSFLCIPVCSQSRKEVTRPKQFEIGVLTFFDFGPPNEYYTLYIVRPTNGGSELERIILTPPADKCFAPARFETAEATLPESVDELLGARNPCEIRQKELKKELKHCKNCMTFSGAKVSMQVSCGGEKRLIRSDILDRDMFSPAAKTPKNTSWTMRLLAKLEKASGPGAMDKPMFAALQDRTTQSAQGTDETVLHTIAEGGFDGLFASGSLKFSDLFHQAQTPSVAHPTVTVKEIEPTKPDKQEMPAYPPITYLSHSEGTVTARFTLLGDGTPNFLTLFLSGNQLFRPVVEKALQSWMFPRGVGGQEAEVTFDFELNCPK